MQRTNWVPALILCAAWVPVAAQTAARDIPDLSVPRLGDVTRCGSVVLLRCDRPPGSAQIATFAANGLESTRTDLFLATLVSADSEFGRVVIFGERQKSKGQVLRELLEAAAPPVEAMSFRTTDNFDGTRCTCTSAPCVLNCCICSPAK